MSMQDTIPPSMWEKSCKRECSESLTFPMLWFPWVVFLMRGEGVLGNFEAATVAPSCNSSSSLACGKICPNQAKHHVP